MARKNTKETPPKGTSARPYLKAIRIYLYRNHDDSVTALATSPEQARTIRKATKEFARLDRIYAKHHADGKHPEFDRAADVVGHGFSAYLRKHGATIPNEETLCLDD